MDYIFKWSSQNSSFFSNILPNGKIVYFPATFVINFSKTCYNLLLKKNFRYFIDPESYKFQLGGEKAFFSKYMEYFEDIDENFDENNKINFDLLENKETFHDLYHKIIQFQERTLARTTIPLEYYMSLVAERPTDYCFNPNANLLCKIAPYFEFAQIDDIPYKYTKKYAEIDRSNYIILRFPKECILNPQFRQQLFEDFHENAGILFNLIELDQYNNYDLETIFPFLIEIIIKFSNPNCRTILMNNAEFCKYFKFFGLSYVCSNVMIGQKTRSNLNENFAMGGSTNLVYIPQIERSISFEQGEVLRARNSLIKSIFTNNIIDYSLEERIRFYYQHLNERILFLNQSSLQNVIVILLKYYNQISEDIHRDQFNHIIKWINLINNKYKELNH